MNSIPIPIDIREYKMEELPEKDQALLSAAIEMTNHSYAPYSHFHVGAALLLENGETIRGCNQENAAFPAGLCAERSAIFAAGAQFPEVAPLALAIAARDTRGRLTSEPVSPCGTCRQVLIETETRYQKKLRILLYGKKRVFVMEGIRNLMPLSFTEF